MSMRTEFHQKSNWTEIELKINQTVIENNANNSITHKHSFGKAANQVKAIS